jgi:hypothetical protein
MMQILAISVYSRDGDVRHVRFRPGRLNIVTGESRTGKSSLLDIVEYCLGRGSVPVSAGVITQTVAWYSVLWQVGQTRVVTARPAPAAGAETQQRALLEVGSELEPLPFTALVPNCDRKTLRRDLSRLIGMDEVDVEPGEGESGRFQTPLVPNIGHAALLCFQTQSEIANRDVLFHRQANSEVAQALRQTLPYLLGAVPADQVLRRQQLTEAKRDLKRAETALATAERAGETVDAQVAALVEEAYGAGLLTHSFYPQRSEAIAALRRAVDARLRERLTDEDPARRDMFARRDALRASLRQVNEQRALLDDALAAGDSYAAAVRTQQGRLASLDLLKVRPNPNDADASVCPLCAQALSRPDATVQELQQAVRDVAGQLSGEQESRPRRARALRDLSETADGLREQIRAVESGLRRLADSDQAAETDQETIAFRRGRIDALLATVDEAEDMQLRVLAGRVEAAARRVEVLSATLDADEERAQTESRLRTISSQITELSDTLRLEHEGSRVNLDGAKLTVVVDTPDGPVPLQRVGSAANWMGYHVATHLALHQYMAEQSRPVPSFLMLDQPTQAYYPPGEKDVRTDDEGLPIDADSLAVRTLFRTLVDWVEAQDGAVQVIVCEHAKLDEAWYTEHTEHDWRGGEALIPPNWLPAASEG